MHIEVPAARCAFLTASGLGLILFAASARADVKIVSEVSVTRQPDNSTADPASPETVTTYYKGHHSRVDVTGGPVTLYNADADRVYTLDPLKKTYYVVPLKQVQEGKDHLTGQEPGGADLDAKMDLKSPNGAETRTIAGMIAKEYDVSGSISVKPRESGSGGIFGGGFPGGGGFPRGGGRHGHRGGGGGGGQRGGQQGRQAPRTEISGEIWLSDAVKLPDDKKATALPAARLLIFGGGPALKPLTDSLNKKKLLPLYSRITLTRAARRSRGDNQGEGGQDSGPASPEQAVTTTTQVKSLNRDALDDALFQVPSGYTQVDPPLTPQRGGGASDLFAPD